MIKQSARFCSLVACLLMIAPVAHAQESAPNFIWTTSKPISIEVSDKILRQSAAKPRPTALRTSARIGKRKNAIGPAKLSSLNAVSCSGGAQSVEIATLAASLKCDPDLIFEYVYNNIEYEPLFGSNKGALGTLLDLRGNDIDQAQLLTALLNASGYSPNYIYGYVRVNGVQASGWLGVKNDGQAIANLFAYGGIPLRNFFINPDGTLSSIDVGHVWVQVRIGGTNYVFDPSYKQHTVSAGLANLGTVLGYTRSQFLSDAGGTPDTNPSINSISNINRANIRSDLFNYATNLINYIKGNGSGWSVADVVGGKAIRYLTGSPLRQTALPILAPSQPSGFPINWGASIPNGYRTCFTISVPGVAGHNCSTATNQNILLYSDETYGHRITLFSTGAGCAPPSGSCTPTVLIDGAAPPNGQNVGTSGIYRSSWTINVDVTTLASSSNYARNIVVTAGGSYVLIAGWGQVGRGMIERHRKLLFQAASAGGSATSEAVLGESLSIISYSWVAEFSTMQRLGDAIGKLTSQLHYVIGVAGQTAITTGNNQGPYVDLPLIVSSEQPQDHSGTNAPGRLTFSGFGSSLESAVLEQTQAITAGMQAASTVKLVDMNAATSAKTYFVDATSSAGLSTYFTSIRPNLVGYSSQTLSLIDAYVSTNGMAIGSPTNNYLLLPINGNITVGSAPWTGAGWTVVQPNLGLGQLISGNLSGGYSGNNVPPATVNQSTPTSTYPPSGDPSIAVGAFAKQPAQQDYHVSEPVDGITGSYTYAHEDLITGRGSFPYALSFSRNYASSANTTDVGVGNGWTHNYSITALRISDPYAALGEGSPISAAAAIAAIYVSQDLFGGALDAQHMTLPWIANRWLTDQLTNNAVVISWPATSEEFIALPHIDGSSTTAYAAPLGSAALLTGTSPDAYGNPTVFAYKNKDQSQLSFNAVSSSTLIGQLASWTFPNGISLGLAYSGGNLSTVSNNLGRRLSLSYSGTHVSSVTDDTGRSVLYGYDGNNNLVSFRDPMAFQTTFAYDGAAGHLTAIAYPSNSGTAFVTNTYDGLGRVSQQANANGNITNFYFAGSRSEIIDPANDRHVTYQTARGAVLKDDWVLSGTANVYYDTAQSNGVVNVTASQYDGLDRLTLTTAPEGGTTGYTYSSDLLNNIVQVVKTQNPGSPLSPLTTSYTYDSIYNKVTSVTDPLGLISTSRYDPATGNILTTVADSGGGSHFHATSIFAYNGTGQVLTATDPLGVVTQYGYDGFGNQTSITRDFGTGRLNQQTIIGYDSLGNVTSVKDPRGNVTTSFYDANRRVVSTTAPPGSSGSGLTTTYTYDADGRVLQTQQSASGTVLRATSATYTLTGEIATATDARGNITRYTYDSVDRIASVADPLGSTTAYGYDAMSRQTSISNAAISGTPLLQKGYTPDGLLASLTDANNHATGFAYDGLDRLSVTTYPDSPTDKETLTYDADSNILSRVTRKGDTINFAYDTLNRVCTKAIAATATACGGTSANPTVFYAYDLAGRSTAVNDNGAAIAAVSGASASYVNTATFDATNRQVSSVWTPTAAQTTLTASSASFMHGYDANNRRVTQAANDNSWLNYPTTASTTNYTPNVLNQYSAVGAVSPTYDGNGNLTTDGTLTYCYDKESRLTSILSAGTCAAPTTTVATYAYDGQGRRKSKTVGGTTTLFVTDADNREVLEYNGSGATQRWYAYGQGSNEVLGQMNVAASTRATLIPDIQGSIIGSLASGGTLTKTGYRSYGENPSLTSGTFNYTAQRFDAETAGSASQPSGIYYYRARMYSPTWGRFLQTDPIGYAGGANLYAYVGNAPLNATDPSGTFSYILQNGNNVIITYPAVFTGSGATSAAISAYTQAAQSQWSHTFGNYNVHLNIVSPAAGASRGQYNVVEIGPLDPNVADGRPFTNAVGGSYVKLGPLTGNAANDSYNLWSAGHEIGGHSALDLADMYNANGPFPQYKNNVMADPITGVPDAQDIANGLYMHSIGYDAGHGTHPSPPSDSSGSSPISSSLPTK